MPKDALLSLLWKAVTNHHTVMFRVRQGRTARCERPSDETSPSFQIVSFVSWLWCHVFASVCRRQTVVHAAARVRKSVRRNVGVWQMTEPAAARPLALWAADWLAPLCWGVATDFYGFSLWHKNMCSRRWLVLLKEHSMIWDLVY